MHTISEKKSEKKSEKSSSGVLAPEKRIRVERETVFSQLKWHQ